ncbi:phage scaffolding protein [Anaerococcus cruorum]|uniref:Phage scaffolding protein n=1 Tax=Anaerococcus cruorum TaxID=3115617 RepID=A0ABW9MWA4_9FIRM
MKTEELKELGLSDEQISGVFKLRGLEVEQSNAIKQALEAEQAENKALRNQIETANNQIKEFKDLDIDSIRKTAEDYQNKFEESENKRQREIEDMSLSHAVDLGLIKAGAKNTKATRALLDYEALKQSKNIDSDLENQINNLKESDSYLFKSEEQEAKQSIAKGNSITDKKDVSEMTYFEMLEANKKGLL